MKQKPNSKNCTSIVAAMITGCAIIDFEEFIGGAPPYSDFDLQRFLLENHIMMGIGAEPPDGKIDNADTEITFKMIPHENRAYFVAESENYPDGTHALYWNGKKVCDPNPTVKDGRPLSDYKIISWFPLNEIK